MCLQARILAKGGFVSPPPEPGLSARVWLDPQHTQIGLAMARSLGDHAGRRNYDHMRCLEYYTGTSWIHSMCLAAYCRPYVCVTLVSGHDVLKSCSYPTHAIACACRATAMLRCAVKAVGVTAEPEVRERELQPEDQFIILASDGVSYTSFSWNSPSITHHVELPTSLLNATCTQC